MEEIISRQRAFFNTHSTKELSFRLEQLEKLGHVLTTHEQQLNEAIFKDFKKSPIENYITELALLLKEIKDIKNNLHYWARKKRVATNLANFPAASYLYPEPLGVCLVIGAWNYPYQLSFAPVIAAIAAGNTVVLKPSELPSHTSSLMATLVKDHFDPAFFTVVEGGVEATTELLDQKFDKIFFTGSTKVGKIVYKAAAKNLTPVTLEMGGKSPAIIMKDAHLKMTVKRLIWAKFLNSGQTCIAPDYVMIEESIEEEFLKLAKEEILSAKYAFENDNYVQIINESNFDRLVGLLDPDKIYYGGKTDKDNRYIQPTLMFNVTFEDAVMQEEIFGPLLPVIVFDKLDHAIDKIRSLPKPLSCYIFTRNKQTERKLLKELSFGGGAINEALMHISNPHLPFGGVGNSGIGNYHGEAGFEAFSHYKSILKKPTWLELPLKYPPYSSSKFRWLKRLMKL
ncbi:aldehyde dehydrogenase [Altibacter sp.]|uniref:aldehyde dehydrogenase n=1 Tax=Altibacter sp. TaxID=2024823 RepID=UPI000C8F2311|nr:aldehyde dehydrogenase [Altibacter sp.]MAP53490.1 aldehyde dehydrogenase [Altibacter sp.]